MTRQSPKKASEWREVRLRSDDVVERLTLALVREPVSFQVKPEPNGWWLVRTKDMWKNDLDQLAQAAAAEAARHP